MAGRKAPKTALVTGANRGIGFEIVRQLAEQGITVLAGARSDKKAQAAGAAFAKIGVTVVPVVLDIAATKRMPSILAEIERRHGRSTFSSTTPPSSSTGPAASAPASSK